MRLALSIAIEVDPNILLVDEIQDAGPTGYSRIPKSPRSQVRFGL